MAPNKRVREYRRMMREKEKQGGGAGGVKKSGSEFKKSKKDGAPEDKKKRKSSQKPRTKAGKVRPTGDEKKESKAKGEPGSKFVKPSPASGKKTTSPASAQKSAPAQSNNAPASCEVFFQYLPHETVEKNIREFFTKEGFTIKAVRLLRDPTTQLCKGVGFVDFGTPEEARTIVEEWNGCDFGEHFGVQSRHLKLSFAKKRY